MTGSDELTFLACQRLSFTMKFMEIVGSEIFWNGIASGFSGEQRVSPILDIRDTGDRYDLTDGRVLYFDSL